MKAEPLGKNTYKITLDKDEAAELPSECDRHEMQRFICEMIDLLSEDGLSMPDGRLLAEMFLRSDGSCVFFITALEQEVSEPELQYCCDIIGTDALTSLCCALSACGARCSIYCGADAESYRLIFADPSPTVCRICTEYGELSEITQLFACQTAEYLTEIFGMGDIRDFCGMIG